jgi:hypothetical protein
LATRGWKLCAWAALAALAAKGLVGGVYYALLYSQDFQWSPAVLLTQGHDPFAWYLLGNPGDRILFSQEPNYLPLLYELLTPFALLSWPVAKAAWALANLGMALFCAAYWTRAAGLRGSAAFAAACAFFAAPPFAHMLGNGQQSLLALFALTLAWRARGASAGGLWLAVGAAKYSLALPFALWFVLERRAAALVVAAALSLAALAVFVAATGADPLTASLEPLQVSARATHVGLADVMSFVRALGLDNGIADVAGLVAAMAGVGAIWTARTRLGERDIFALLCVVSLFALFHNLYDYVLLLPLFCVAWRWRTGARAAALGYVGFFWWVVPFAEPWLKSSAAIGAMALFSAAAVAFLARHALGDVSRIAPQAPDESSDAARQPEIQAQRLRDAALVESLDL